LNVRTNNALIQTFNVNTLNELTSATRSGTLTVAGSATEPRGDVSGLALGVTNVTVSGTGLSSGPAEIYHEGDWARSGATLADGNNSYTASGQDTYGRTSQDSVSVDLPVTNTFVYDLNGNLCTNNTRVFDYDDENQLIRVTEPGKWKTEFTYDGLLRMRKRKEFAWSGSAWTQTNEVHYVYDGQLVIQERDGNNLSLVTYTRGNDLSGTLQGAGGIGGLLARTDNGQMIGGSPTATALYVADANGNVIRMFYTNGTTAARYNYDPYGNMLTMSGPVATANKYRFSSKGWNGSAGLYYYGFRFYEPSLQRWLNKDPLGESSGVNLYRYVGNTPLFFIDEYGLCNWSEVRQGALTTAGGIGSIVLGAATIETVVGAGGILAGVPTTGLGLTTMAHGLWGKGPVNTPTGTIPQGPTELIGSATGKPNLQAAGSLADLGLSFLTPPSWGGPLNALNDALSPPSVDYDSWPFEPSDDFWNPPLDSTPRDQWPNYWDQTQCGL
jgi:RHS repeat-associated protein